MRRFVEQHAGEERTERERHAEQLRRAEGDTHRAGQHAQGEQLARAGAGHALQHPGQHAASDDQHQRDEAADLGQRGEQRNAEAAALVLAGAAGQCGHQHQRQHHRQVLDDQPADRDPSAIAVEHAPALQRAQQDHGAGDRQRKAEDDALRMRPAEAPAEKPAHRGGDGHLYDRPRHGDIPHGDEVAHRKMQADAEHQQDHADFGELRRQGLIADEAGGVRADQHAGEQIADDR